MLLRILPTCIDTSSTAPRCSRKQSNVTGDDRLSDVIMLVFRTKSGVSHDYPMFKLQ